MKYRDYLMHFNVLREYFHVLGKGCERINDGSRESNFPDKSVTGKCQYFMTNLLQEQKHSALKS